MNVILELDSYENTINTAKKLIRISEAFYSGKMDQYYNKVVSRMTKLISYDLKLTEFRVTSVFNTNDTDKESEFDEFFSGGYMCYYPGSVLNACFSSLDEDVEFISDFLEIENFTPEIYFQLSTIYDNYRLNVQLLYWYLEKNYKKSFYIDLVYYDEVQKYLYAI